MLIRFTTSIKTILILLLFIIGELNLYAVNTPVCLFQPDTIITKINTAKQAIPQSDVFVIPENIRKETINFQVNSEISYLSFSHFVKNESKRIFYTAWMKEKEVRKLSAQTDSLRRSYANSSNGQQEKISAQILKAEGQLMNLNEEIPGLYEKARAEENQYWQSVSPNEILKFQGKIRLYQDSILQTATRLNKQRLPDTITYYKAEPKPVANTEPATAITYKIQVGAYKGKLPETAAKSIKKLGVLRKVENYKDEKGVTVYTTGSLKRYQEALTLQSQVKLEGIKNATIVAYNNGKRITLDEARKLNNEPVKP
jgi:cell division protein FtsN